MISKYEKDQQVIHSLLDENPQLRGKCRELLETAYDRALRQQNSDKISFFKGYPKDRFYIFDQALEDEWEDDR